MLRARALPEAPGRPCPHPRAWTAAPRGSRGGGTSAAPPRRGTRRAARELTLKCEGGAGGADPTGTARWWNGGRATSMLLDGTGRDGGVGSLAQPRYPLSRRAAPGGLDPKEKSARYPKKNAFTQLLSVPRHHRCLPGQAEKAAAGLAQERMWSPRPRRGQGPAGLPPRRWLPSAPGGEGPPGAPAPGENNYGGKGGGGGRPPRKAREEERHRTPRQPRPGAPRPAQPRGGRIPAPAPSPTRLPREELGGGGEGGRTPGRAAPRSRPPGPAAPSPSPGGSGPWARAAWRRSRAASEAAWAACAARWRPWGSSRRWRAPPSRSPSRPAHGRSGAPPEGAPRPGAAPRRPGPPTPRPGAAAAAAARPGAALPATAAAVEAARDPWLRRDPPALPWRGSAAQSPGSQPRMPRSPDRGSSCCCRFFSLLGRETDPAAATGKTTLTVWRFPEPGPARPAPLSRRRKLTHTTLQTKVRSYARPNHSPPPAPPLLSPPAPYPTEAACAAQLSCARPPAPPLPRGAPGARGAARPPPAPRRATDRSRLTPRLAGRPTAPPCAPVRTSPNSRPPGLGCQGAVPPTRTFFCFPNFYPNFQAAALPSPPARKGAPPRDPPPGRAAPHSRPARGAWGGIGPGRLPPASALPQRGRPKWGGGGARPYAEQRGGRARPVGPRLTWRWRGGRAPGGTGLQASRGCHRRDEAGSGERDGARSARGLTHFVPIPQRFHWLESLPLHLTCCGSEKLVRKGMRHQRNNLLLDKTGEGREDKTARKTASISMLFQYRKVTQNFYCYPRRNIYVTVWPFRVCDGAARPSWVNRET